MNQLLSAIGSHPSKRISDSVRNDPNIIDLTVGVPSYGPPPIFAQELVSLVTGPNRRDADSYADSRGDSSLRQAIATRYRQRYGLEINPDSEILVTHGGAEAIWLSIFTLTNAGDTVLIPDPAYMLYAPIVKSLGRQPRFLNACASDGFALRPESIEESITPSTTLLLLNSPANPTGAVCSRETILRIAQIAERHRLFVMHDEVFDDITFSAPHVPITAAASNRELFVLANSASKRYGMTGWRLGWMIGPAAVIKEAAKAHTYQSLAVGTAIQQALAVTINHEASAGYVAKHTAETQQKLAAMAAQLDLIKGVHTGPVPGGGFYLFPNVTGLARSVAPSGSGRPAGDLVADLLLKDFKIAVVPGAAFGEAGRDHIRISVAGLPERLAEATQRLSRLAESK